MDTHPVAYPRITSIADPDTFEFFPPTQSQGLLSGFCTISKRPAALFAQEPTRFAGAMGFAESAQLCALMDETLRRKSPIVGLLHSSGAKIQEGVQSLAGYADIFKRNVDLSGVVPQISVVMGPCAGGAVYSPALTDFVIMVRDKGEMFITGPDVIRETTGEITDRKTLGGAETHAASSGVAHLITNDETRASRLVKMLLAYLPSSSDDSAPDEETRDASDRRNPDLDMLSKQDRRKAYDVRQVIASVADRETFLEIHAEYAKNVAVGFARLAGLSVGFVANNPMELAGALDSNSSIKAARFVRFCDSFNIPIITLVDVPGYWPGADQERGGIIRNGAKLIYAYAESAVPRVTVVVHKAYGGAYCVMGSKQCGAFANFAWPTAEIAVMGPQGAVEILHRRELDASSNPEKVKAIMVEEYLKSFANPDLALKQGYIDKVIDPSRTRIEIIAALKSALEGFSPHFKHRNMPL